MVTYMCYLVFHTLLKANKPNSNKTIIKAQINDHLTNMVILSLSHRIKLSLWQSVFILDFENSTLFSNHWMMNNLYIGHFSFHMRLKCEMKSKHNEAKRNTVKWKAI
jgi:hypothetical protein